MTQEIPAPDAERLRRHRQEHLLHWWDNLTPPQRRTLSAQVAEVNFEQITELAARSEPGIDGQESPAEKARRAVPPAQLVRVPHDDHDRQAWTAARKTGVKLLRDGRVGVILVAGGEGTRLGFPHPKGQFPVGPVSGKPLFQLLAEQVVARARQARAPIPYYVMTSPATHDETLEFFESHSYFGLSRGDVHFFRQGTMPAVDRRTGRLP